MTDKKLYYGDNLDVLRRHIKDETVDLVYLDPPFNSQQDYNVLFRERDGSRAAAQREAFKDTWVWDEPAAAAFQEIVETGGRVAQVMRGFKMAIGDKNDMLAYLAMMAPRLVELHRVLKPTGSIYLHCDPTASHYLKLLMDAVFDPKNFRNEIIWKRSQPKSHNSVRYSRCHDVILFYAKSDRAPFHQQYREHDPDYVAKFYRHVEPGSGRRYRLGDLTNPNKNRPNLTYEFPPGSGVVRVWRWTEERMMRAWEQGIVVVPENGGVAQAKRYLDEMAGTPITDLWDDIEHLHGEQEEIQGYPTQKPEALLERIVRTSTDEGDLVLDPFCGCGTAIAVAQKLNRRWIGIDITAVATHHIKNRLNTAFGERVPYEVIGEPTTLPDAETLAESDPYQFQWWSLGLVGARPVEERKGADYGVDGRLFFHDGPDGDETEQVIFSVKAGKLMPSYVRDLRGVIEREEAAIGVLLTMKEPSQAMRSEAATAGFFHSAIYNKKYPKLQILTVADLLKGKGVDMPPVRQVNATFKRAPKAKAMTRLEPALALDD